MKIRQTASKDKGSSDSEDDGRSGKGHNLASCFSSFSIEETLGGDDQWYCNVCKEHRDIKKKLEIYKVPKIMIIHLKRFQQRRGMSQRSGMFGAMYAQIAGTEKNDAFVDFPIKGLDVRPYVTSLKDAKDPVYYDLIGVSNHFGSLGGGHYTAACMNNISGDWHYFNDSSVSNASKTNIVSSAAYVLFYRRRD